DSDISGRLSASGFSNCFEISRILKNWDTLSRRVKTFSVSALSSYQRLLSSDGSHSVFRDATKRFSEVKDWKPWVAIASTRATWSALLRCLRMPANHGLYSSKTGPEASRMADRIVCLMSFRQADKPAKLKS